MPKGQAASSAGEGFLHHVLGELEVPRAVDAGEDRHHFRRLVAEEVVGELVCGGWPIFGGGFHAGGGPLLQRTRAGSKDIGRGDYPGTC